MNEQERTAISKLAKDYKISLNTASFIYSYGSIPHNFQEFPVGTNMEDLIELKTRREGMSREEAAFVLPYEMGIYPTSAIVPIMAEETQDE